MPNEAGDFAPWFGVFETLRVIKGVPLFVAEHRVELGRAMEALELATNFDFKQAQAGLRSFTGRWRWIVTQEVTRTLFSEEETPSAEPMELSVSPVRVGSCNWDARFKTLSYLSHAQAWKTAPTPEAVLLNERNRVASASRGNIFWRRGDRVFTPAHEEGCRCGVVRAFVFKHQQVESGRFPLNHLLEADEIFLTNSMKGIVSVSRLQERSWESFPCADKLRAEYAAAVEAQVKGQPFWRLPSK